MSIQNNREPVSAAFPRENLLTRADFRLIDARYRAYKRLRRGASGLSFGWPIFVLAYVKEKTGSLNRAALRGLDKETLQRLPRDGSSDRLKSPRKQVQRLLESRFWRGVRADPLSEEISWQSMGAKDAAAWRQLKTAQKIADQIKAAGQVSRRHVLRARAISADQLKELERLVESQSLCIRRNRESGSYVWQEPTPYEMKRAVVQIEVAIGGHNGNREGDSKLSRNRRSKNGVSRGARRLHALGHD